jgi:hypothetical protein
MALRTQMMNERQRLRDEARARHVVGLADAGMGLPQTPATP